MFKKRIPNEIVGWETNPETGQKYPVDKDGKIVPERYLFGILPDYGNPFKDDGTKETRNRRWAYAVMVGLALVAARYYSG